MSEISSVMTIAHIMCLLEESIPVKYEANTQCATYVKSFFLNIILPFLCAKYTFLKIALKSVRGHLCYEHAMNEVPNQVSILPKLPFS